MTDLTKLHELLDKYENVSKQIKEKQHELGRLKNLREQIVNDMDTVLPNSLSLHMYKDED